MVIQTYYLTTETTLETLQINHLALYSKNSKCFCKSCTKTTNIHLPHNNHRTRFIYACLFQIQSIHTCLSRVSVCKSASNSRLLVFWRDIILLASSPSTMKARSRPPQPTRNTDQPTKWSHVRHDPPACKSTQHICGAALFVLHGCPLWFGRYACMRPRTTDQQRPSLHKQTDSHIVAADAVTRTRLPSYFTHSGIFYDPKLTDPGISDHKNPQHVREWIQKYVWSVCWNRDSTWLFAEHMCVFVCAGLDLPGGCCCTKNSKNAVWY